MEGGEEAGFHGEWCGGWGHAAEEVEEAADFAFGRTAFGAGGEVVGHTAPLGERQGVVDVVVDAGCRVTTCRRSSRSIRGSPAVHF